MKTRLLLPVAPALACLAFAAPSFAASPEAVSENWAGYEAASSDANGFSSVSGDWTQPAAKCTTGGTDYAAFWVGLGGGTQQSDALEQIGTQAVCTANGSANYYAWYELVPAAPVKLDLKISPGDKISAKTTVNGTSVTLSLSDHTTGQSVSKTLTMTNPNPDTSTAEWVAEAPSQCENGATSECTPLPLADFGTVTFTNATATAGGHTGTISDSQWNAEPIALAPASSGLLGGGYGGYGAYSGLGGGYGGYGAYSGLGGGYGTSTSESAGATPSSLSSNGGQFTVTYGGQSSSTTGSGGSGSSTSTGGDGGGYGYGYGGSSGYGDSSGYGYGDGYGYDGSGGYGSGYGGYGSGYGGYGSGYGAYSDGYGYTTGGALYYYTY